MVESIGILDSDSLYFRICYKTHKKNEIRKHIDAQMEEIYGACLCPDEMLVAIKGKDNFRNAIYPDYKSNRRPLEEDMKKALNYAHDYMIEKHNAKPSTGMEADDLVSIWAHEARAAEIPYTICGIDKDLLQIPGVHYNFVKKEYTEIDDDTGYKLLMLQCLTGDSCDNIPGIRGIGPKKAEKILEGIPRDRQWNRVRAAWRAKNAGDPNLSWRLLAMIKSWDEYEEIKASLPG